MDTPWYLHVAGIGNPDAATNALASFAGTLRDAGLRVEEVKGIDGGTTYFPNVDGGNTEPETSENGWALEMIGAGDIDVAHRELPTLLRKFSEAGLQVRSSGITQGVMRDVPIPA